MTIIFNTGLPASGSLTLQKCGQCGRMNYPARELCGRCLADDLHWQSVKDTGLVQSQVQLHYSLEPAYAEHLPWTVASVKLDCGPVILAHLPPGIETNSPVRLKVIQDSAGNRMLVALGTDEAAQQTATDWLVAVQFREVSA